MDADDVVTASLAALELGETICIPGWKASRNLTDRSP